MRFLQQAALAALLPWILNAQQFNPRIAQSSVDRALRDTRTSAVLVDVATGWTIASYGGQRGSAVAPGSTLKPLVGATALFGGTVTAQTRVACHATLTIAGHRLNCTHPSAITIFDLQDAIAYSCNSWFAQLAAHMDSSQLVDGLRRYGLSPATLATSVEQRQLLALGVAGIRTTPQQLAEAYRRLALQWSDARLAPVENGMLDSVRYGMAHNAKMNGVLLAGKTGTAENDNTAGSHGLFAGIIVAEETGKPVAVVVVMVPNGNGADAAALARKCLLSWKDAR